MPDLYTIAVAIPAVLFAAISKAGFGSGAAFASSAILALVIPPGQALGIMLPILMLIDVASLKPYWKKWHGPSAQALVLGAVPGVALGAALYTVVDDDIFRVLIGAMCLAFVAWQGARAGGLIGSGGIRYSPAVGAGFGGVAGFTSFVSHAGGPPAAVFLLGQGLAKTTYQATTVIVFWAINLMKVVPYAFLGIFTVQTLLLDALMIPVALLGTWLGVRAHHWMPERAFFALTYALLTITGLRLIWIAL